MKTFYSYVFPPFFLGTKEALTTEFYWIAYNLYMKQIMRIEILKKSFESKMPKSTPSVCLPSLSFFFHLATFEKGVSLIQMIFRGF